MSEITWTKPLLDAHPLPEHISKSNDWPTKHLPLNAWIDAGKAWKTLGLEGAKVSIEMSLEEL